jgi:DNA-directed RNA polymerase specialized sigma24 family protein
MRPLNMPAGSHGGWQLLADMHRPPDVTEAVRTLAAQGLKPFHIAERLCVGLGAVEQALRDGGTA